MDYSQRSTLYALRFLDHYNRVSPSKIYHISEYKMRYCLYIGSGTWTLHYGNSSHREELVPDANSADFNAPEKASNVQDNELMTRIVRSILHARNVRKYEVFGFRTLRCF